MASKKIPAIITQEEFEEQSSGDKE